MPAVLGLNVLKVFLKNGTSRLISVAMGNIVAFFLFMLSWKMLVSEFLMFSEYGSLTYFITETFTLVLLASFFIYTLIYRKNPEVKTTFKEIITVGDITSDNIFLQIILFVVLYGFSLITIFFPLLYWLD